MSKNILVIAAHPDDEVLGCAGTIIRHSSNGDNVGVLYVADGVGARNELFEENIKKRKQSAEQALQILGAQNLGFLDFPDNRLDSVPLLDIVQKIEVIIRNFLPHVVFTHHSGDLNIDHEIVSRATMTACRPIPGSSVKEIYTYEVMSSTEWALDGSAFIPNYFVDINEFWDRKKSALDVYNDEMRISPHTRSIKHLESLAIHRGNCVGMEKAEAFQMLFHLKI